MAVDYYNRTIDPVVAIYWIQTFVFLVYSILWTINTLHHKNVRVLLHKVLYIILILEFFLSLGDAIATTYIFKFPRNEVATVLANIFNVLSNVGIASFSLVFLSGLSIVFESLPTLHIVLICVAGLIYSISLFLLEFIIATTPTFATTLLLIIVYAVAYMIFLFEILRFSSLAMNALHIHLEMIIERGINPKTTPTYRKIKLISFTRNCTMFLFLFWEICYILYFLGILEFWSIRLVIALFVIILFGIICYKFRIRQAMAATYGDDEDAYIVHQENEENSESSSELESWKPGVVLPPIPQINHHSQNKIHAKDPE